MMVAVLHSTVNHSAPKLGLQMVKMRKAGWDSDVTGLPIDRGYAWVIAFCKKQTTEIRNKESVWDNE